MTEISTRKEAIEQGRPKYYTGKPCKNGHYSQRYSVSGACLQCVRDGDTLNKANAKAMLLSHSTTSEMVH
jgi:hypothetical protein